MCIFAKNPISSSHANLIDYVPGSDTEIKLSQTSPNFQRNTSGNESPPGGQSLGSEWEFTKDRLTDARACDMPNAQTQGSLKKLGTKVA